ncbi:lysine exporter LysO family protein [Acetomicrobium sp. S15 = DSM 107314]|uniref:lysine exporter LysO family protein n=1 Tax=Acetomicrobium sp. S15 = DSM 107314 TaxID=2529858 RepID=UPI0018E0FA9B|nr:lysine exporter LysO family protein [Acetomicrobium sp. S15 = DSM 107314]
MELRALAFLASGILVGYSGLAEWAFTVSDKIVSWLLLFLFFFIGADMALKGSLGELLRLKGREIFLPFASLLGGAAGGFLAGWMAGASLPLATASGIGSGYYSITTVLLKEMADPTSATIGFLVNLMRECLVIAAAPFLVRLFGKHGTVGIAGATAMDVALPFITKSAGGEIALLSFASGVVVSVLVPVMVPLSYHIVERVFGA